MLLVDSSVRDAVQQEIVIIAVQDVSFLIERIIDRKLNADHSASEHPFGAQIHTAVSRDVKPEIIRAVFPEKRITDGVFIREEFDFLQEDVLRVQPIFGQILLRILRTGSGYTEEQKHDPHKSG